MSTSLSYLPNFKDYILAEDLVSEKHSDFYINWVRGLLRNFEAHPSVITDADIQQHLLFLRGKPNLQPWQLEQAEHALKLYSKYFMPLLVSGKLESLRSSIALNIKGDENWDQILHLVHERLKLRHYALSTQKTYLGWLKQFREFSNNSSFRFRIEFK